jgi:hypothetical protein
LDLVQSILQFVGVFVSLSIAYVSFKGVRQTESSTLLRLATAFAFLGLGFLVEAIGGLGDFVPAVGVYTATIATGALLIGLLLETTGYFFLAFSHALDVVLARRLGVALMIFPVITLSTVQVQDVLSILSFYFVAYGVVETIYAYARNKRPDTILIAGGLSLIAVGTFVQWLSFLYPPVNVLPLVEIIMKEMGLMTLFIPVLGFALGRGGRADGTV